MPAPARKLAAARPSPRLAAIAAAFASACSLATARPALAYIPPSGFILKSMASKHALGKPVRIRGTVTAMEGEKLLPAHFKEVTVFDPKTGVLRMVALDDAGQKLFTLERKTGSLTAVDELLFGRNLSPLEEALKAKGIPIKTEAELLQLPTEPERVEAETEWLARWNGGYAWVIGKDAAKPVTEGVPQLWVEKDTFLPLRLVYAPKGDDFVDLMFENYRHYREFPFPRSLVLAPRTGAVLREDIQDVAFASDFSELKGAPSSAGLTEAGNSVPSDVRELLHRYYEMIR